MDNVGTSNLEIKKIKKKKRIRLPKIKSRSKSLLKQEKGFNLQGL